MTVDLSSGCMGIIGITWSGGVSRYYCPSVTAEPDGTFTVRIESGVYWEYLKDGTCVTVPHRPVVEFIPCSYDDPRAAGMRTETCP